MDVLHLIPLALYQLLHLHVFPFICCPGYRIESQVFEEHGQSASIVANSSFLECRNPFIIDRRHDLAAHGVAECLEFDNFLLLS
jgi:hypothetical protein